ncbi:MAG: cell wall-binding repeat-containing protein [Euzebya sp.]
MRSTAHTRGMVVLLVALVAALSSTVVSPPPAAAQGAGSITFVRDHNVWIMAADDPSSARAVTTDGTEGSPYLSPTQDDSGRILVIAGGEGGDIVRMDQQGAVLTPPFRPPLAGNLIDLDVRGDGEIFAYTDYGSYDAGNGAFVVAPSVAFAYADGRDSSDIASPVFDESYASYSTDRTFLTSYDDDLNPTIATYAPGDADLQDWFLPCEADQSSVDDFGFCFPTFADVTTAQDRLTVAVPGDSGVPVGSRLWVFDMAGPAPATPSWGCELVGPTLESSFGTAEFYAPEWSPDGSGLVYEYYADPADNLANGIYVASGFDSGCDQALASAELVVPGGSYPDWSPAALGASPGTPDPGPAPVPPAGELTDGARLDGGSAADPIGQAIATSQLLFANGAADRVVLATADRFPDALAGAALAGDDGPILLTAGLGGLDQRTAAEITRVTGGDGVVLVLGGTSAVSDQAAGEAAAAAGGRPCSAPLPTSCRFAGTGREHTAALIGEVVLAEHPGSTALIARGDDFADAITGGAYAARAGVPILLTPSTSLNAHTQSFLQDRGITTGIVLGGTAAVDDATYAALPVQERRRVAGGERTATAAAIAEQLWRGQGLGSGGVVLVNVRAADGWQTALTAAVVSAVHDAPQVGVETPPAPLGEATRQYLSGVVGPIMAFGGADLVSDDQMDQAALSRG